MNKRLILSTLLMIALSGCAHQRAQMALAERGVATQFNQKSVEKSSKELNAVLTEFENRAGGGSKLGGDASKNFAVFLSASDYINEQCDRYLNARDKYQKYFDRAQGYTTNTATAVDVILAAANVSQKAIGITAASFGLVSDSLEVTKSTLLDGVESSTLQKLVTNHQAELVKDVRKNKSQLDSKAATVVKIRDYLRTCLPTSLKMMVNASVQASNVKVDDGVITVNGQ